MFREVLILGATSVYIRLAVPCERRKINALTGNHKFPLTNPSGYGTTIV